MRTLCIIPARGGSKRIPRKNIKIFFGKPIIAYSIEAALKSCLFEEIMVSTDDHEIEEIAKKYGAVVPFLRSKKTANDFAGLTEVLIEVVEQYKNTNRIFDSICCILPTAPFVTSEKLIKAKEIYIKENFDCIFPVVEYSYPIQRSLKMHDGYVKMRWPENIAKRSQDLESSYHDAGQFYFIKTDVLLKEEKLFTEHSGGLVLSSLEVQDIDTEIDWQLAELKYKLINSVK